MKKLTVSSCVLAVSALLLGACAAPQPGSVPAASDNSTPSTPSDVPVVSPTSALDATAWLDAAIAATQVSDTFTMYTQEWLADNSSSGNCTKEYVDYSTGTYQYIILNLAEPATIKSEGCAPESETPYAAMVSDRYYPDLSADPSANLTGVIQADPSIQRAYWDEYLLPWQCYRDIVTDADSVTVADDDRGLAVATSAAPPDSCEPHFYVGTPGKGNSTWTFTTDETGRLSSVEGAVPEGVDADTSNAEPNADTVTRSHRNLFTDYGAGHSLGAAVNGMTAAQLAALPVTATATTTDEIAHLDSTLGLGD